MLPLARRATFGLLVAAASFVAFACGGDDTGGAGDNGGGSDSGASDVSTQGDASASDAGADAAKAALATITVLAGPTPASGATIVFYTPDGAPQPAIKTGADGKGSMVVPSGSSATVSAPGLNMSTSLITFLGVEPGDDLEADVGFVEPILGSMNIATPPTYVGASSYVFGNGCGGGGDDNTDLEVLAHCAVGGKVDAFALAEDNTGKVIAYAQKTGATFTDGVTVTLDAWVAATNETLTTTGAWPSAPGASLGEGFYLVGEGAFAATFLKSVPADGGIGVTQIGLPVGSFLTDVTSAASLTFPFADPFQSFISVSIQGPLGPLTIDLNALPPKVHDPVIGTDGAGEVILGFTADGDISGFDGMSVSSSWTAPSDAGSRFFDWRVIAPAATALTLPRLTADLVSSFPTSSISVDNILVEKGTLFGSYGAYRTKASVTKDNGPWPSHASDIASGLYRSE
jgi:hypothetical protein